MQEGVDIETDFSHLGGGFYFPLIRIKVDIMDFTVIVVNLLIFFVLGYTAICNC